MAEQTPAAFDIYAMCSYCLLEYSGAMERAKILKKKIHFLFPCYCLGISIKHLFSASKLATMDRPSAFLFTDAHVCVQHFVINNELDEEGGHLFPV